MLIADPTSIKAFELNVLFSNLINVLYSWYYWRLFEDI
jgi:hypothetical protein